MALSVLLSILVTLFIVGAVLYLVKISPIDGFIKQVMYVIVVIFVLIWLLESLPLGIHPFYIR